MDRRKFSQTDIATKNTVPVVLSLGEIYIPFKAIKVLCDLGYTETQLVNLLKKINKVEDGTNVHFTH